MTNQNQSAVQSGILKALQAEAVKTDALKKLFTQGCNGLPSASIILEIKQLLNLVGVELPEGVTIGLDGAQAFLAGGAFVNDVEKGVSTLQCVGDLTTGLAGIADILAKCGLIDSQVGDFLSLATMGMLVVSSGGANVLADIGFVISAITVVFDLSKDFFGSSQAAENEAKQKLNQAVTNYLSPQIQYAASQAALYTKGEQSVFDLIGNVALNSPAEFASLFPSLAVLFPSWMTKGISATGISKGLFSSESATDSATFFSLLTNKAQVESVLINKYITEPMLPFEQFTTVKPVISLEALSILSMILSTSPAGDIELGFDFNVVGAMRAMGVTPSVLGDDWLFKGLQRNEKELDDWETLLPYAPLTRPRVDFVQSGVVINGVTQLTASEVAQNAEAAALVSLQKQMQALDTSGDVEGLLAIPEACAMLDQYGAFHIEPVFYTVGEMQNDLNAYNAQVSRLNTELSAALSDLTSPAEAVQVDTIQKEIAALVRPSTPVGEILNMKLTGTSITTQSWFSVSISTDPATAIGGLFWTYVKANYKLDMSDYWKCLSVLKTMQSASLFSDAENVLDKYGSIDVIEAAFQPAYQFYFMKQLNIKARQQLASNLGIPTSQLKSRYDSKGNIIFYKKAA